MVACATDFEPDVNEFTISGLTPETCIKISPPRVQESRISYECKLNQIVPIGNEGPGGGFVVIGTVVLFHIDDEVYDNGRINLDKLNPVGRLSGHTYTRTKDTLNNIESTGEFVINIVSEDFAEQMVACATDFEPEINEFTISDLTTERCMKISPPRVQEARISYECKLNQIVPVGNEGPGGGFVVIGTVVLFHIDDEVYDLSLIHI